MVGTGQISGPRAGRNRKYRHSKYSSGGGPISGPRLAQVQCYLVITPPISRPRAGGRRAAGERHLVAGQGTVQDLRPKPKPKPKPMPKPMPNPNPNPNPNLGAVQDLRVLLLAASAAGREREPLCEGAAVLTEHAARQLPEWHD